MMGIHQPQPDLFSYQVNLEKRVRPDHPLRQVAQAVDFTFARAEVANLYGGNGNESVDPAILLKMMFLLFYDNVSSERELMNVIPERLDYLWFLGYGLDDAVPNHSVLSKARRRWGKEIFRRLFFRTIEQCVAAGLVGGDKLHVDGSLIGANASKDSVIKSSPELIAAYAAAFEAAEKKLNDPAERPSYEAVNDTRISTTDPDAGLVRKGGQGSHPAYHHHRAVDDAHGVITAVEITSGSIAENKKLMTLVEQHEQNTRCQVKTAVADHKYGTAENFVACYQKGIVTHLGDAKAKAGKVEEIYPESQFKYDPKADHYLCPAGQALRRRRYIKRQRVWEYAADKAVCVGCALRSQCTRSQTGRTLSRHENAEALEVCRQQSHSATGRRNRQRRQYLLEGSFADAANNHGFKRARWRRLWRQQIQDYLIAAIQNIRILLARTVLRPAASNVIDLKAAMGDVIGLGKQRAPLGNEIFAL
ncbi:MAG TPA: IS1182 family transposase [Lacunisphaera sp.]|jgi:transposase